MIKMHLINFQKRSMNSYKKNLNTIVLFIDYDKNIFNQINNQLDIDVLGNDTIRLNNANYSLMLDEKIFSSERTTIDFYNKIVNNDILNIIKENISNVDNYSKLKEINNMTDSEFNDIINKDNLFKCQNKYFSMNKIPYIEKEISESFYLDHFKEINLDFIFEKLFEENREDEEKLKYVYTLAELFLTLKQGKNIFYNYNKEVDKKYYRSIFINSLFN
ncbi:hypothetical protein UFVDC4_00172 [Staphylococcus phage vB_SauM-UFV_DC4]|nr:hypothetical protein UFVDC4_00172 [Staphylococcus phage vB_SauM-UFV_DC4]